MLGRAQYAAVNEMLGQKLTEKKCLIAVHRGGWGGNIIQNTVGAYKAAFMMGADMVESDINSSTDGILYSFHDGNEPRVLGVQKNIKCMSSKEIEAIHPLNSLSIKCSRRINRLTEILDFLPQDGLLNIDRAWDIFPKVLAVLDQYPHVIHQVVIKAPMKETAALEALAAHPKKYMFMPICYSMADVEKAVSLEAVNTVGAELVVAHPEDELFSDAAISRIHEWHLFCWVNAITLGDVGRNSLCAGFDDDISVLQGPALGWGKLFAKKIDIIQTDWPSLLFDYRRTALGV